MPMTSDQIATARDWGGLEVTEASLNARFERMGNDLDKTIAGEMRSQLSGLIDSPSQVSLPGGLSVNFQANIQELQRKIKDFMNLGGTDGVPDPPSTNGRGKRVRPDFR